VRTVDEVFKGFEKWRMCLPMLRIEKIKVEPGLKLGDIIRDVERGKLRVPRFQREFVWERPKVVKLLDSMYNQFPIGSFFFWNAPRKYNKFFRNIAELNLPEPDEREDLTFILDGQQRITSLYATIKGFTLNGVSYGNICFDLEKEESVTRSPDNSRYVAFCDLFNYDAFFKIYNQLSDENKKKLEKCKYIFENYPLSVVLVRDLELDDVCEVFERINQSGKRLSLMDLVVANTWSEEFDLREKIKTFNASLAGKGFQEMDAEAAVESLSLNIKGGSTRSMQLQMSTGEIKNIWDETIQSINLAIDFLRANLGVQRYDFLPYRGIIPIIAYYFYSSKNRSVNLVHKRMIEKWFWRVSFSERFARATPTRMTEDKKLFDQMVQGKPVSIDYPVSLDAETIKDIKMQTTSAIKNAVLCLLATKEPKHFRNNTPIKLDDSYFSDFNAPEKHHIFPASFLEQQGIHEFSLPNFCFIPAELNKEISATKPSEYFKQLKAENPEFEKTMACHLIPVDTDSGIWTDDYIKFIEQRAILLKNHIESVI